METETSFLVFSNNIELNQSIYVIVRLLVQRETSNEEGDC